MSEEKFWLSRNIYRNWLMRWCVISAQTWAKYFRAVTLSALSLFITHTYRHSFKQQIANFWDQRWVYPHHILLVMRNRHVHPLLHTCAHTHTHTHTLLVRAYMLLLHARPFKLNTGVSKGQTRSKSQHWGLPSSKSYRQSQAGTTTWIPIKCHHLCPICACGHVLHLSKWSADHLSLCEVAKYTGRFGEIT